MSVIQQDSHSIQARASRLPSEEQDIRFIMNTELSYTIERTRFDEHYRPAENTRITTNFANLARGESREENLRNTLIMISNRFNSLAHWDNPNGDRYAVELDIVSVELDADAEIGGPGIPLIEVLQTKIVDRQTGKRTDGIVGNNFSSYVRDYDFSVVLQEHNQGRPAFSVPDDFGDLHGKLFKSFVSSKAYRENFAKPPVICLSVSNSRVYHRTENHHPVLGYEYRQEQHSLTDSYFSKMGLQVRYFMPPGSVAPLAFYFSGDLPVDYTELELIGTISVMDTFQKIYRPEIYNANSVAGRCFQPRLEHQDYSLTRIVYDREERSRLAREQAKRVEDSFIRPYRRFLAQWSAAFVL